MKQARPLIKQLKELDNMTPAQQWAFWRSYREELKNEYNRKKIQRKTRRKRH